MALLAVFFVAPSALAQTADEEERSIEDLTVAELMRLATEARAEADAAEQEFRAATVRMREAEQDLVEACGEQPRPDKVAMAKATMDRQIAQSAGVLADFNAMEADNNMFGTGGIGVGAPAFVGGVIGSSYGNYGGQVIMGALDKSVIDRVIKQHWPEILDYYQEQKAVNPELATGRIVVKFVITKDGTVSSAKIEESELDNDLIEHHVCACFEQMVFPSPTGGGFMVVSYPIMLR